ncbi:MAG: Holliday junction resolvase Hjc [archaeon]
MSTKSKGTNAERDLVKMFWSAGWAAIRSAGSGSMHYPSPDILAGNKIRRLAIEAKATKDDKKYFHKDDLRDLINFSSYFGAEPWVAIKFSKQEWIFVSPNDIRETGEGFVFSRSEVKGVSFEELISSMN